MLSIVAIAGMYACTTFAGMLLLSFANSKNFFVNKRFLAPTRYLYPPRSLPVTSTSGTLTFGSGSVTLNISKSLSALNSSM